MLDRIYTALITYVYGGALLVGCCVVSLAIAVAELAGFRGKDLRFEDDKIIYRS